MRCSSSCGALLGGLDDLADLGLGLVDQHHESAGGGTVGLDLLGAQPRAVHVAKQVVLGADLGVELSRVDAVGHASRLHSVSKTHPARMTVIRTEQLTPSLLRVVFGGDGFDDFAERDLALNGGAFTDKYVKLVFLADGFDYPEPLNLDEVRETMPQDAWPVLRTYTIRWVDHEARELAVDFVIHGDEGFAGPWASAARARRRAAPARPEWRLRCPTRRPTGTCSSATRQRCRRSARRSRRSSPAPGRWPSSRSTGPTTSCR